MLQGTPDPVLARDDGTDAAVFVDLQGQSLEDPRQVRGPEGDPRLLVRADPGDAPEDAPGRGRRGHLPQADRAPGPRGPDPPAGHRHPADRPPGPARPAEGRGGPDGRGLPAPPGQGGRLPDPQGDDEGQLHRGLAEPAVEAELARLRGELTGSSTTAKQLDAPAEDATAAPQAPAQAPVEEERR